jgi:translation initiation factor 1 (eIF-1/SUI1)
VAVNNETLAMNLAKKLAKRLDQKVTVVRSRRRTRKFYLAVPSHGMDAPRSSDHVATVAP